MEKLKQYFQNKDLKTVLDVGTGTGDFINVLKEVFPDATISGVDPNAESLSAARVKYPDIEFDEMSAENLSFSDNTFDVASISMALHHLTDIHKSLKEMKRVVKPGGWIIVNELFSDNLNEAQKVHKLYHHFRSSIDRILGVSHNETFKRNEILSMISASGIKIDYLFDNEPKQIDMSQTEIAEHIEKMTSSLQKIKDLSAYQNLLPQIEQFRAKVNKYGFQSATRVVVVGKV